MDGLSGELLRGRRGVLMGRRKKGKENRGFVISDYRITIPLPIRKKLKVENGMLWEAEVLDENSMKVTFIRV